MESAGPDNGAVPPTITGGGERPWFRSYPPGVPRELKHELPGSLVSLFEQACEEFADFPAFECEERRLTYRQVGNLARDCAAWLQQVAGLRKTHRIALMCPNILPFPVAMLGNLMCGASQVNVNPRYTATELEHQLKDADARVVLVADTALPTLLEVLGDVDIRHVVIINKDDCTAASAGKEKTLPDVDGVTFHLFSDVLASGKSLPFDAVDIGPDDCAFLQYTGGTTGVAKGARLSHGNLTAAIECKMAFMQDAFEKGKETGLAVMPLYHILGLQVFCFLFPHLGGRVRLVPDASNPDLLLDELVRRPRITFIAGVNALFDRIMNHPRVEDIDLSHVKLSIGGGTAIQAVVSERWKRLTGKHIKEGYGLSEAAGGVSLTPLHIEEFTGNVGLPYPSLDVSLRDDGNNEVAPGSPGEICVSGPIVMMGYTGGEADNAAAFTDDGYFKTGDIGVLDGSGFLHIVDRKKDVILVSGFNVYPIEIEGVIADVPGVRECACIGVPDEKSGERAMAFVVRQPGSDVDADEIMTFCKERLTAYKRPRRIRFVDSLPRSAAGKILKNKLRNIAGNS